MMNWFAKNGRVRKFWLTETTGPLPEVIPNILVRRTYWNFRNLCIGTMANICSFHVSMHCSMASEVMEYFPLLFLLLQCINQACFWITRVWCCTCERSKWKCRDCVTFHRFLNIVIGDASDVEWTQKIGRVVTLRRIKQALVEYKWVVSVRIKVYSRSLVQRSGELLLIFISLRGAVIFFSAVRYISRGWVDEFYLQTFESLEISSHPVLRV